MTFKITDEEYAVLCEIRKNKTTSIDRLKMMFYDSAQPAVSNLEAYDLIRADFPRTDCYYATEAGLNYRHEESETTYSNVKQENDASTHDPNEKQTQKEVANDSAGRNIPLVIWREFKSFFLDVLRIVFRKD